MKKSRVAIMTWHYYKNFGSALQTSIEKQGYFVKLINYRNPKLGKCATIK